MIWKGLKYQTYDFSDKYEISEYGDVRNIQTGCILKPHINRGGYKYVCISLNKRHEIGQRKTIIVHKAVGYTFLADSNNNICIDHVDGNKSNNHYSNLEWVTFGENTKRAFANGLIRKHGVIKPTADDVISIRAMLSSASMTHEQIANMFGVTRGTVTQIKNRKIHADI